MSIDLAGITKPEAPDYIAKCPKACTEKRCVISTVASCRHPCLSSDEGCGPVTMANRHKARRVLGIVLPASDGDIR